MDALWELSPFTPEFGEQTSLASMSQHFKVGINRQITDFAPIIRRPRQTLVMEAAHVKEVTSRCRHAMWDKIIVVEPHTVKRCGILTTVFVFANCVCFKI